MKFSLLYSGKLRSYSGVMFVVYVSHLSVGVLQLGAFLLRLVSPLLQPLQEKWVGAFPLLFAMHVEKTAIKDY